MHSKLYPFFVAFCSNLSQIDHGDLVYDNGGIIGFTLNDTKPNGTVASYSCSSGFSINTPDSTRICFDGDWTGTEPACISSKPYRYMYGTACACITIYHNYHNYVKIIE